MPSSPAVDAGDPDPTFNDTDGSRNDMGAIALNEAFFDLSGCTNPEASNFESTAVFDDGSCVVIPTNDECINAISLSSGETFEGSLCGAQSEDIPIFLTGADTAFGVYFTFNSSDFDSFSFNATNVGNANLGFVQFQGHSCDDIEVLVGCQVEDVCSGPVDAFLDVEPATDYYFLIYTTEPLACGDFEFTVTGLAYGCTDATAVNFDPEANEEDFSCTFDASPSNDECSSAVELDCNTQVVGSTGGASASGTPNDLDNCTANPGSGVWYSFVGDGQFHTVDLCGSAIDATIDVFKAETSCGGSSYETPPADPCGEQVHVEYEVGGGSWDSEIGWSLVDGNGSTVLSGAAGSNQACLPPGSYTLNMSDSYGDGWNGAAASFSNFLGDVLGQATLNTGASGSATIDIVPYSMDPILVPGEFTCVASGSGFVDCEFASNQGVSFLAEEDALYYLYVGDSGEAGSFNLSFGCEAHVPGCTNAAACDYNPEANVDSGCDFFSCLCPDTTGTQVAFRMMDSFGDGWNGGAYTVTNALGEVVANGSLDEASWSIDNNNFVGPDFGFDYFCLSPGCHQISVEGSAYPSEVSWELQTESGEVLASGGSNDGQPATVCVGDGVAGCTDMEACNYDPTATENDFTCEFESCAGCTDNVACNYDYQATIENNTCCYANCVFVNMYDSAGDGWNGAIYELSTVGGELVGSGTLSNGGSDSDMYCLADGCYTLTVTEGIWPFELSWDIQGAFGVLPSGGANETVAFQVNGDPESACIAGCTDSLACNFNPDATIEDGACTYPGPGECDCEGHVLDECGICGGFELQGQYFNDFESCELTDFAASGGSISITSNAFEGSCAVYMQHFAGQVPNNFYPIDRSFGFGTYEVMANGNNGISDNIIRLFAGDALESEALTFAIRPQSTDNPGVTISGFGVDVDLGPPPVTRGEWYRVTMEILPNTSRLLLNGLEVADWSTPEELPEEGRFKLAAAYTGIYDNMSFTPYAPCDCEGNYPDVLGECNGDCEADVNANGICDSEESGCMDVTACNYAAGVVFDDGSCTYIAEGACDCDGNVLDECGVCGGDGIPLGSCDCDGNMIDECGVCGGAGATLECGCNPLPEGYCDCEGTPIDACGVCGGNGESCAGCMDPDACNYDDEALLEDGSCLYPAAGLQDCYVGAALCGEGTVWDALTQTCVAFENCPTDLDENGNVGIGDLLLLLADYGNDCEVGCPGALDACGVCNGPGAIYECGCTYLPVGDCDCAGNQPDAIGTCGGSCAVDADGDGICDDVDDCIGQLDECGVCNGAGAIYECGCSGIAPGACDCEGQQLDAVGVCGGDCELDENGNGICDSEEEVWSCGDDLLYQGYSYKTTAIGNQCWFAENLRAETFNDGTPIPELSEDADWASADEPAKSAYDNNNALFDEYGWLYNGFTTMSDLNVCPVGWMVPLDVDGYGFEALSSFVQDSLQIDFTSVGQELKSVEGWEGEEGLVDPFGFSAIPGGSRQSNGSFEDLGDHSTFWSSSLASPASLYGYNETGGIQLPANGLPTPPQGRLIRLNQTQLWYSISHPRGGRSLRCMTDIE